MSTRLSIAALITMMINSIIFGIGAVAVLSVPSLADNASTLLPAVIVASFIVAPIIAWFMAPLLRSRWQRRQSELQRRADEQSETQGLHTVR